MARLLDEMFEADIETMIALNIAFLVVFAIGPYLRMYARRVELPAACGVFYNWSAGACEPPLSYY